MNRWTRLLTRLNSPELLLRFGSLYPQNTLTFTHIHSSSPTFSKISSFSTNSVNPLSPKPNPRDDTGEVAVSGGEKPDWRKLVKEIIKNVVFLRCESTAEGGSCNVYLIGTNHVSQESATQVQTLIRILKPQVVFLELCSRRKGVLTRQNLKVPTIGDMIGGWKKKHNLFGIFCSWSLAKAADTLEVLPGSEFRVAFEEARAYGGKVILGDRPVQITLQRISAKMTLRKKIKLACSLFQRRSENLSKLVKVMDDVDINDKLSLMKLLKEMDDDDMLTLVNQEMSRMCPTLMETLVDERDQYMSSTLLKVASEHSSVVAVVGKGHLQGIKKYWKQPVELKEILEIPSQKAGVSAVKVITSLGVAVAGATIICYEYGFEI